MTDEKISDLPIAGSKCVLCGKPAVQRYKPFCSKRCADIDLNRWLSGVYAVPTEEPPVDTADASAENDENF